MPGLKVNIRYIQRLDIYYDGALDCYGTPVGTTDLVSGTTERVSQLGPASPTAPGGNSFADVDVAREHAVKQRLVGIRVNL